MPVLRAIVTGLLAMLFGSTALAAACDGFTDVASTASYCTAVTYLKDHGITLGCTGTTFCPDAFVTRSQMALFLQRAAQGDSTNSVGDATATVGGGEFNSATHYASTVAGGSANVASGSGSFIGGGDDNMASGIDSVVAGGNGNFAIGGFSFAGGQKASANGDGCFVWGDFTTLNEVRCDAPNRFVVRAEGGIFLFAGNDGQNEQTHYTGVVLPPGAQAWVAASDRNGKEHFQPVDAGAVLRKVAELPIATWNWKSQDVSIRHMGPMAQDFSAAFELGETPRGISTIDADGVALAAIQGLNAKLESQLDARDALIAEQARALSVLQARVEILEHQPATH